jgi:hypothetical protein
MATVLFTYPNTGYRVRSWVPEEETSDSAERYELIECRACGQLHCINTASRRNLIGHGDHVRDRYWINSSAVARSMSGMVRPRAYIRPS